MKSSGQADSVLERFCLEFEMAGSSEPWLFSLKPRAISLMVGTAEILTFDREGRLYAAFLDGRNYRRGLDNRILEKYTQQEEECHLRQRRLLGAEEQERFLARISARVRQLDEGEWRFVERPSEEQLAAFRRWIARLRRWDASALAADGRRFHQIYRTVSILPPDQYMALVVQTSEGCPWNRCTFCDLYRDRPYRVKTPQELQAHLEAIRDFLGEGIRLRRSIFLGDANMLAVPLKALLAALEQIRKSLAGSGGPEERFYGFTDTFGVRRHSREGLRLLHQEGVQRLYLGLETGSDGLLHLLRKPGKAAEVVAAVRQLHQADIAVGVIVLLGLGGQRWAREHEEKTIQALDEMELGDGDLIYFSPLVEHAHGEYAHQARELGFASLDLPAMQTQRKRIEAGLHFGAGKPLLSIYDIRDFIY